MNNIIFKTLRTNDSFSIDGRGQIFIKSTETYNGETHAFTDEYDRRIKIDDADVARLDVVTRGRAPFRELERQILHMSRSQCQYALVSMAEFQDMQLDVAIALAHQQPREDE